MGYRFTKRLPAFDGVAAGQTATCKLPLGLTYHGVDVEYAGVTLAQINECRVMLNGKPIQRWATGAQLDMSNQFDRLTAAGGILRFTFDRIGMRTRGGEELTAIGTKDERVTSLYVEMDIDAAAVGTTLAARASCSEGRPMGYLKFVRQYPRSAAGAGEFDIADFPKGGVYSRVFLASAAVASLIIERDQYEVFNRAAALNTRIQTDGVRTPQANVFCWDTGELGYATDGIPTMGVQDWRFKPTMTGADTIQCIVETVEPFGV